MSLLAYYANCPFYRNEKLFRLRFPCFTTLCNQTFSNFGTSFRTFLPLFPNKKLGFRASGIGLILPPPPPIAPHSACRSCYPTVLNEQFNFYLEIFNLPAGRLLHVYKVRPYLAGRSSFPGDDCINLLITIL